MHAVCLSKDGAPLVLCLPGVPRVYCTVSRLPNSAHNVPSAWNTLSPLVLLANAYSLIRTELKDTASWKTSPGASTSSPSTSGHTLRLSTHSASLTIKAEKNVSMALGTYCVPTLSYRIIWLNMSTSPCHAVPQGKRTFRSTRCEFLPPVEQTRHIVIYHINCIPTEGTYCHLLIVAVPGTDSEQAADERKQRANRNTAQNTSNAVFTVLHGAKIGQ